MPYKDKEKQKEYQRNWVAKKYADPIKKTERRNYRNNLSDERRKQLREYKKGLKCIQCGENHPATLDFHHINPDEKVETIGRMIAEKYSWETILKEINKCIVLCSNCHRKLHYEEQTIFTD